jgi:hypothetical protein
MLSFARRRFTFANVAITVALVFAMSGGAYAAGKFLITSTKQISPKVLKSLQGKAGPAGGAGAQGPAGPGGPAGPQGSAGPKGETGAQGVPGTSGANGKNGTNGKNGEPWTAGGTLPSGKTETGAWSVGPLASSTGHIEVVETIASFPIPLAAALPASGVHFINGGGKEVVAGVEQASTKCQGNVEVPTAEPGNLCIYSVRETFFGKAVAGDSTEIYNFNFEGGSGTAGALATFGTSVPNGAEGQGTFAVTAP